jgi:hypothetical protein
MDSHDVESHICQALPQQGRQGGEGGEQDRDLDSHVEAVDSGGESDADHGGGEAEGQGLALVQFSAQLQLFSWGTAGGLGGSSEHKRLR